MRPGAIQNVKDHKWYVGFNWEGMDARWQCWQKRISRSRAQLSAPFVGEASSGSRMPSTGDVLAACNRGKPEVGSSIQADCQEQLSCALRGRGYQETVASKVIAKIFLVSCCTPHHHSRSLCSASAVTWNLLGYEIFQNQCKRPVGAELLGVFAKTKDFRVCFHVERVQRQGEFAV